MVKGNSIGGEASMKKWKPETEATHCGEKFGEKGAMNVPIYQNSTFKQKIPGTWEEFTYTRTNNPTEDALRKSIASLEGGDYGVAFSSGLAAINGITELFTHGDHVVSTADIYGGTERLFQRFTEKRGLEFSFVDTTKIEVVEAALKKNTKLIYVETPSNPLLTITDLRRLSSLAKAKGILLAVDNTIATPYFQRPLELGADLVVSSSSKYLSGHTNVVGGVVAMKSAELYDRLKFIRKATGGVPGPFDCYLTMLGLKTLPLRMKQHEINAQAVANFLRDHQKVQKVHYPGLEDHPQHELAKQQMSGFGGIVTIEINGDADAAKRFVIQLELFSLAISFGSVISLVDYPATMSHKEMVREERLRRGFTDSLVRLSLGIENSSDLIQDLDHALSQV
jgi:cystathionine gamma-lyase